MKPITLKTFLIPIILLVSCMVICYIQLVTPLILVVALLYIILDICFSKSIYGKWAALSMLVLNIVLMLMATFSAYYRMQMISMYGYISISAHHYLSLLLLLAIDLLQLVLLGVHLVQIIKFKKTKETEDSSLS